FDRTPRAPTARRHESPEAALPEHLGLASAADSDAVETHSTHGLVAGGVAVVVLHDAAGELDVEHRELGFVGAEAPQLRLVGDRVEPAAAIGCRRVVSRESARRACDHAVRLTELAVERR